MFTLKTKYQNRFQKLKKKTLQLLKSLSLFLMCLLNIRCNSQSLHVYMGKIISSFSWQSEDQMLSEANHCTLNLA